MTANLVLGGSRRLFRPSMLATCLTVALVPLFVTLGNWQYGKAQDKIARQAMLEQRLAGPVLEVRGGGVTLREIEYRPVRLHGNYLVGASFLLDNQIAEGRAGYAALTPFHLEGGGVVLVNRGWVVAPGDHRQSPAIRALPDGAGAKGLAVALPRPGMRLAGANNAGAVHAWVDVAALSAQLREPVAEWMVVLDHDAPGALRVDWPQPAERVHTNLGYAWQWFGFAVAAIGIWLWHGWRRARGEGLA